MQKETQKAMDMEQGKVKLVDVKQEKEIIERITFSTLQSSIRMNADKLEEIKNKLKKEKSAEKQHLIADVFVQSKMRLNNGMVFAEGDFDENWQKLKEKVFGEALN